MSRQAAQRDETGNHPVGSYRHVRNLHPPTRRGFLHTDHAQWQAFVTKFADDQIAGVPAPVYGHGCKTREQVRILTCAATTEGMTESEWTRAIIQRGIKTAQGGES